MSTQNNLVIVTHSVKQHGAQLNKLIIYDPLIKCELDFDTHPFVKAIKKPH